jgi:hypothetical protein
MAGVNVKRIGLVLTVSARRTYTTTQWPSSWYKGTMDAVRSAPAPSLLRRTARSLGARRIVRAVHGAKQRLDDLSYEINTRYWITPRSERLFLAHQPALSQVQRRVVQDLQISGISMVPFRELFAGESPDLWTQFEETARTFARSERVRSEAELYRANTDRSGWKEYVVKHFEGKPRLDVTDPVLRLGLRPQLLDTVNAYLRLWAKLRSVNMWYTIPLAAAGARNASQRWHRDPEDRRLVKVFLYVDQVDAAAGPLEYIPGSRRGGPYAHLWPFAGGGGFHNGSYPPQAEVEAAVPPEARVRGECPPATLLFCDTSGFHRGGYAIGKERLLGVWMFVTPASRAVRSFSVDDRARASLSPTAQYAVS